MRSFMDREVNQNPIGIMLLGLDKFLVIEGHISKPLNNLWRDNP